MALYVRRLIWDNWNIPHIARHDVTPDEVEEMCHGDHVMLAGYDGRILVLGTDGSWANAGSSVGTGGEARLLPGNSPACKSQRAKVLASA